MTAYVRCRTCGKFVTAPETHAHAFCSKECVRTYHTCINCGRHFLRSEGYDDRHCSKACTVKYVIQRRYGPQPVTVLTEV